MKRVCIRFNSLDDNYQTFTLCNEFSKYTSARTWVAWAKQQLLDRITQTTISAGHGKLSIGPFGNYAVEIVSIGV